MTGLVWGLLALVAGQLAGFWLNATYLNDVRRRRALRRFSAEYEEGDTCSELRDSSGGPRLLGRCVIYSITKGRVEFRELNKAGTAYRRSLVVTGQEAEGLHPILQLGDSSGSH